MNENNTKILDLFAVYTAKKINKEQFNMLQDWINQSPENKQQFSNYLLFYKRSRRIAFTNVLDQGKAWNSIVSQLKQPLIQAVVKERKIRKLYYRYVASVLIVVALTIFLNKEDDTPQFIEPIIIINNNIEAGIDKATLTLEDGSDVTLVKGQVYQSNNISSNGEEIVYIETAIKETVYNYLTIPRGGQFNITLSDGTQVWLNSESQLKYPITFVKGQARQVELVYGEAYFDVSPSTQHKGLKFKVINQSQEVEVLGTEFNIKAYKDEHNVYTTLVEGEVAINTSKINQILAPGEQANLNVKTSSLSISPVNVQFEIGWKEGLFSFKRKTLKEIMQVLSRWYDMDVTFANKSMEEVRFIGTLGKNQNIIEILNNIKTFGIIKGYEINNKTVILK